MADGGTDIDLGAHLRYLRGEKAAAERAQLSALKAILVAMLIDAYPDRLFAAQRSPTTSWRSAPALPPPSRALGLVFALVAGGVRPVALAVTVPVEDYSALTVQDFMVSLCNGYTVQRVLRGGGGLVAARRACRAAARGGAVC